MKCDRCDKEDPTAKSFSWVFGKKLAQIPRGLHLSLAGPKEIYEVTYGDFRVFSGCVCSACAAIERRKSIRRSLLYATLAVAAGIALVTIIARQEPGEDISLPAGGSLVGLLVFGAGAIGFFLRRSSDFAQDQANKKAAVLGMTNYWTLEDFKKLASRQ